MSKRVEQWIRAELRQLSAYHVPEPGQWIKLDAMENPYQWPSEMREAWLRELAEVAINRYPDPSARQLALCLRESEQIPASAGLILGNGSDELIQMLLMTVAAPGRTVLAPKPSFVMYELISRWLGLQFVGVPLQADFKLDPAAMLAAIKKHQPAVVFLAYPNNPTGNLFDESVIAAIVQAAPGLVVLDEAYHAFAGGCSFMSRLADYEHLLVMRTVSKMGLAGLRLGYLVGAPAWLDQIDKLRLPYNINVLTQCSAEFALIHRAVLDEQTALITADRQTVFDALSQLPGVTPYPSATNFVLFRVANGQADRIFQGLLDQGVLIKNQNHADPMLKDCLRVTIGTAEENQAFIQALQRVID